MPRRRWQHTTSPAIGGSSRRSARPRRPIPQGYPGGPRPLGAITGKLVEGPDLDSVRRAFEPFSTALADLALAAHVHHREGVTIFQCPMTQILGTGRWLSRSNQLRNPFFGSAMLECGEEVHEDP